MKKIFLFFMTLCMTMSVSYAQLPVLSSYEFVKGDKVLNVNVGVGAMDGSASFGQQLSMEWCVVDGWFDNRASLGVGFSLVNSAFGSYTEAKYGTYDYNYPVYALITHTQRDHWSVSNTVHRKGVGNTMADVEQDNLAMMGKASFHYQFIDNLDTYFTFGIGMGLSFRSYSYYGTTGFDSKSYVGERIKYQYNDMDHVTWINGSKPMSVSLALSSLLGARYYFSEHLAANAELGMIGQCFATYGAGCSVFMVGLSVRF